MISREEHIEEAKDVCPDCEYNSRTRIIGIDALGIRLFYKGDEIWWIYPWKRKNKKKWLSLLFEAEFKSLKELDKTWDGFFKEMIKE